MASSWRHPGRTGALLYAIAASVVGGALTVVSRLQIAKQRGRRRVATALPDGGIIVISNHTSYADGLLLALVCRRLGRSLRMLATSGVFRAPVLGWLVRRLGFIPVERGTIRAAESLTPALEALAAGEAVGIFPEGGLTRDPDKWPGRAKTGAVRLALRSGAPIVPIAMVGAHRVLDRGHMASQLVSNILLRPRVDTAVGAPIDVRAWVTDPDDPGQIRDATERVMARLTGLVEELRGELAPTGDPPVDHAG
jgi:1-acyl-sn-glycerol-3-phosphate acyltransferase